MEFPETRSIPPSPAATVFLHGLLLLSRNASGGCDIGIHRTAPQHDLRIDIAMEKPFPFPLTNLPGHLQGRDFQIEAQTTTGSGVRKYVPRGSFDRATSQDAKDFRWAVNLGGPEFHDLPLSSDTAQTRPAVIINEGILYSTQLSDEAEVGIWRKGGGKNDENFHRIAGYIGVDLYLDPLDSILLSWQNPSGHDKSLSLPNLAPGFRYSIKVNNDPPQGHPNPHDELAEYYRVVRKQGVPIPPNEQFRLEVAPLVASLPNVKMSIFGSDRIPCMPIVIDG